MSTVYCLVIHKYFASYPQAVNISKYIYESKYYQYLQLHFRLHLKLTTYKSI
nr:MAG TPA: hypothetical protein [Caudoviricetes sp.]